MKTDWIDLCKELGWAECRIPVRMRDPMSYGMGWCSSLAALYATLDPRPNGATVDPRSGGIIGWRRFIEEISPEPQRPVCQRTARRILDKPYGKSVQMVGGVPATTVNTAHEIRRLHDLEVSEVRRQARLGGHPGQDLAPDSTYLVNTQPIIETAPAPPQDHEVRMWNLGKL